MKDQPPEKTALWLFFALGIFFIFVLFLQDLLRSDIPWSQAKERIVEGNVELIEIDGEIVKIHLKEPDKEFKTSTLQTVYIPQDETFLPLMESQNIVYRAIPKSGCETGTSLLSTFLILGFFAYFFLRLQRIGPGGNLAKSKASIATQSESKVRFSDVAGIEEAKEEVEELVDFLKYPQRFTALGGKIPKGVLLVGPPGTGKTLLAKAVAGEAGVPFFHTSGSDFVEIYVGVGAARVRDLFQEAKKKAPCIVFIDELDAMGKTRSRNGLQSNDEREQTLNQLLVAMDGFDSQQGVIVMAATNRAETLDPALLRAGRFDRQISVDRPDIKGRHKILQVHAAEVVLSEDVQLWEVARMTSGFSGADLANTLNEAALLAARRKKDTITMLEIEEAIERTVAGLEKKSKKLDEEERKLIAYHECGHAICARAMPKTDPVQKISIIPRGIGALGYTLQSPEKDKTLYSRQELLSKLVIYMGGRVAEQIVFDDFTTGAADDLQRASDLAHRMVFQLGMSDLIGPLSYTGRSGGFIDQKTSALSAQTFEMLDQEVRVLIMKAQETAREILEHNRIVLDEMSQKLLEEETLRGAVLDNYLERVVLMSSFVKKETVKK